eukprot:7751558-Ditylum_brightwellii.AAC.1
MSLGSPNGRKNDSIARVATDSESGSPSANATAANEVRQQRYVNIFFAPSLSTTLSPGDQKSRNATSSGAPASHPCISPAASCAT